MVEGLKKPLSLGQINPSSSMLKGAGIAGSWKVAVGETIIFSANEEGGKVGAGVLMPLRILRRILANKMRSVKAYLRNYPVSVCSLAIIDSVTFRQQHRKGAVLIVQLGP